VQLDQWADEAVSGIDQGNCLIDHIGGVGQWRVDAECFDDGPASPIVLTVPRRGVRDGSARLAVGKDVEGVEGSFVRHMGGGDGSLVFHVIGPKYAARWTNGAAGSARVGKRDRGEGRDQKHNREDEKSMRGPTFLDQRSKQAFLTRLLRAAFARAVAGVAVGSTRPGSPTATRCLGIPLDAIRPHPTGHADSQRLWVSLPVHGTLSPRG
jgi:hypothetical protein